jgi:hypothetical protein
MSRDRRLRNKGYCKDASCLYIKTAIFERTKKGLRNRAGGRDRFDEIFLGVILWPLSIGNPWRGSKCPGGQLQIFKACMGEKQKEEVQNSYPVASSSSSCASQP